MLKINILNIVKKKLQYFKQELRSYFVSLIMPREYIILECTEARAEGKPVSRYMSTRDKRKQPEKVEKRKYNRHLQRHTLHREIKD